MSILHLKPHDEKTVASAGIDIDQTNKRLIVNRYPNHIAPAELCTDLIAIAKHHQAEKIWLWSFLKDVSEFTKRGFVVEGVMADDVLHKPAFSLAYYINPRRGSSKRIDQENEVLARISSSPVKKAVPLPEEINLRLLKESDSPAISGLLGKIFATYPTPVEDPFYIKELMDKDCLFAGAYHGKKLVSVAAAYFDANLLRCEMTDCATHPLYRGKSLAEKLLTILEPEIEKRGNYTLYTLARAMSYGMNRTFYKLGYRYKGRLINNCHIAGGFEDMNLWVKY